MVLPFIPAMNSPHPPSSQTRRSTQIAAALGVYAFAGGLASLSGWVFDVRRLTDWYDKTISIQPNTAVVTIAAALALLLLLKEKRRAVMWLGMAAALIGAATLFEQLTDIDLGIDTLLIFDRPWGGMATTSPGRMGTPGATCWTLLGISLVLAVRGGTWRRVAPILAIVVAGVSGMSLTGYLYGADMLYSLPRYTAIALQTATFLFALAIGVVAAVPDRDPMRTLLDDTSAGYIARRALPLAIAVPLFLGFLRIRGQQMGLYDLAMGSAMLVLLLVLMICGVLWWAVHTVGLRERRLIAANEARDRADADRHASESRVVATLNGITDGFITLSSDWRYTYANDEAVRMLQMSRSDLLGQSVWELFPELEGTAFQSALLKAAAERVVTEIADTAPVRGRWYVNRVHPTDDNSISIYFRDVTEQRDADARAFRSEQQARTLINVLPGSAAFVVDRELRYTLAGGEALHATGMRPEDVVGKRIEQVLDADMIATHEPHFRKALSGSPFSHEHDRDGRSYISRGVPLRTESGEVYAAVVVSHDITERKRAEEALRNADRRKDDFLAILAHELRNPLAPIANALEIIKWAEGNAALIQQQCAMMDRQLQQMVRLIDDLMDVGRITRNKLQLRKAPVNLASILRHSIEACRPLIDLGSHPVELKMPAETVMLDGDGPRLTQVFGNLITNACKYSEPGDAITIVAEHEGDDVVVCVADNGVGIAKEMLEIVFEPFTQLDHSVERARGGLGIGLSLVKQLVALHGGSVRAESEGLGRGTRFVVRLPALIQAAQAPTRHLASNGSHDIVLPNASFAEITTTPDARRILVVDDNRDAANSLATLLRLRGHDTSIAHDGAEAVERAKVYQPHVVLLDIGMPLMNGYEACRAIRQQESATRCTMIALTGWGQEADRQKSKEAGFDGHLVKPIDFGDLVAMMGKA